MSPRVAATAAFFTLLGLLKYGLVLAAILVYLPFTIYPRVPLHGMLGGLFTELSPLSAFWAAVFAFLTSWAVMIVEGLIVNGVELHFLGSTPGRGYRTFDEIRHPNTRILPRWADELFTVPLTTGQFVLFTVTLAGPAVTVIVMNARPGQRLWALGAVALAFVVAYALLIIAAAPPAIFDPTDPPLRGWWPLAEWVRTWWILRAFTALAGPFCSSLARLLRLRYILDVNERICSGHFFAAIAGLGFVILWGFTGWVFYPGRWTATALVYLYVSLLLFVWFFGALRFHLGRWHVSPLVAGALILLLGYFTLDHRYGPAEGSGAATVSIDPIEVAAASDDNLVVVAAAGGGLWAAGWTARGLEQLVSNRAALRKEIRVISAVSGGSVGAAYFIDGLLRGGTLHDIRVRSTASTLGAVAYALTFRDFPRVVTGGAYNPSVDRGRLLEEEWARVAAATVVSEDVGARPPPMLGKRAFRTLNSSIRDGSVPAPIFGATIMETGQRLMITPITFAPPGPARASTLQEFLFRTESGVTQPDLDLWTAARLSATFTYVSPPARSWLDACPSQRKHLIDGGYYDEYGVTSALDWLMPVLEARKAGDRRLRFKRVLLIELSAFPTPDPESVKPADGLTATLTGPTLTAFLALRQGVATSRNRIDLDRFKRSWNERFGGAVLIETVKFQPDASGAPRPISWHLTSKDIERLKAEWGPSIDPETWPPSLHAEWRVLDGFLRGDRAPR